MRQIEYQTDRATSCLLVPARHRTNSTKRPKRRNSVQKNTNPVPRAFTLALLLIFARGALAVDGGKNVYLLGKRGPLAAFIPKPGIYLSNDIYSYDASYDGNMPLGGRLASDISADALMDIPQFTWVTDVSALGGRLALSALTPFGTVDVRARGAVQLPDGTEVGRGKSDTDSGFGDPVVGASLGWKNRDGDRFRAWSVYSSVFIPVGSYQLGRIANLSSNRWAVDVGGAYTMANFRGGRELSGILGFTFNGENEDTNYDSGNELHLELAGIQHLPNHWSAGIVGYYYNQVTPDSGGPAVIGDFEGKVAAIGPELNYQFQTKHPVSVDLRWYHEFSSQNRLEGDGIFLTISVPLHIQPKRAEAQDQDWTQAEEGGEIQ